MTDIQPMRLEDLKLVLEWAGQEGWNPGLEDAAAFFDADPKGFLLKRVNGKPAAAISVVNHAPDFAFLGLYICKPEFRGQGHGLAVWKAGLAHAQNRTVGLDGVPDQQSNYAASGFVAGGKTTRYSGWPGKGAYTAVLAGDSDVPALCELDFVHTGVARPSFIVPWFSPNPTRQTLSVRGDDGIKGYVTIRRCAQGFKLGPFAAQNKAVAMDLLLAAADWAGQGPFIMDVPDRATLLSRLLLDLGFTASFETARMYLGTPPLADPWPFQAVATLELG